MTGKTHSLGGCQAGLLMITLHPTATIAQKGVMLGAGVLGSLLVDIDHPNSKISHSDIVMGAISRGVSSVFKHRREIHTPIACVLFGLLAYLLARVTIQRANASTAFMCACVVLFLCVINHNKMGSIIAIATYIFYPMVAGYIPFNLPEVTLPSSYSVTVGVCVLLGCVSHLIYDTCNVQGIMWLFPLTDKRFSVLPITTGTAGEAIFATVMSLVVVVWVALLSKEGVLI